MPHAAKAAKKVAKNPTKRVRKRAADPGSSLPTDVESRLLETIERLVGEGQSFARLSVAQLAQEAGIGRATFYLHFKDKAELVHRLMRHLTDEVVKNSGAWFEGGQVDARSMQTALRGIITTFKRHAAILAAVSDTAPHDAAVAEAHAAMMTELCGLSRKAISRVRRNGNATDAANHDLADLLTLSIEAYCARHIHEFDGKRLDGLIDRVTHICGRAIFSDYPG